MRRHGDGKDGDYRSLSERIKTGMAIRNQHSLVANCSPESVWQVFQDVARWPEWNDVIGSAAWVEGQPWQKDARLRIEIVRPISLTLEPQVLGTAPPNVVHWGGGGMGVKAEILFRFDPQQDGTTLMQVWQEFTGAATMFVTQRMKRDVITLFDGWLQSLKREAERLSAGGTTQPARPETSPS